MAQNNLARNLTSQEEPQINVSAPERAINPGTVAKPHLKLNSFEKLLIVCGSAVLTVLMLLVVSSKIALSDSQHQLQHLDSQITMNSNNTNLQQQVGELQSSSRLQKIAKENGMSLSNGNIRNVTK
ncbi:cell division protein FtsL [Lentilactobacillus parafarraginis F0439]|uniref:Cell division protein FtsL n=1 Tax=Lentilactobacillus parafarraginis F0439 TaxID=797515 RepID=G9ZKZ9_9LACO|nr:cell division protein FtsL [Lentilactobacillus parafarraginis]EHM00758.1 cell division protein FtsL [Lentilactobacillus parafarraginis F0439]